MRTIPDGTQQSAGALGKPIRPEAKPPEDVIVEVKPGVWSMNGKLQTFPPKPKTDWKAIADALEEWAASHSVDIVILADGISCVPRDPEFPREEWGTW